MARKQPPIQQAPPAQRIRLRYARRGPVRFTSSRDFGRILERAIRRAAIPMAYSSGFTPHPRISYANAAPTSAASEAEYVELALARRCDPAKVVVALNNVLPHGFVVLDAAEARPDSLADLLQASDWEINLDDTASGLLAEACASLLAAEEAEVERMTKNGMRTFDVRGAVLDIRAAGEGRIELRLKHLTPLVRPDDVMAVLRRLAPDLPAGPALLTRLRQGPLGADGIEDPLRGEPVEQ